MDEQRRAVLFRPPMHCHWGPSDECLRNGKITRLSITYRTCFIQTKAQVELEQQIFIKLWLPDEFVQERQFVAQHVSLHGKVARFLPKVGFGLQFDDLSDGEAELLNLLVGFYQEPRASQPASD